MKTDPPELRRLDDKDASALNEYLLAHADTTMFLRGNLARGGFEYAGESFQGVYVGAFDSERIVGVVGHSWRDSLMVEAPLAILPALVRETIRLSGRPVSGFMGACEQVKCARRELGWQDAPVILASEEILYRVELADIVVPAALASGEHICRKPRESDLDVLVRWRESYAIEALGRPPEQAKEFGNRRGILLQADRGDLFVLEVGGQLVAQTGFSTRMPECVQVGGVWTPKEFRSQGYARSAVAGSLLAAREEGAVRSILFTAEANFPAQACYKKLGYREVGDYMLLHFEVNQSL